MNSLEHKLARFRGHGYRRFIPGNRLLRAYARRKRAMSYLTPQLDLVKKWIWEDSAISNHYYKISNLNKIHLSHLIADITEQDLENISRYLDEIENDLDLRSQIQFAMYGENSGKTQIEFGRRIGWYAIIRATKPKLVVETGVHHGLGACVIAKALKENQSEGFPGRYLGTDIDTSAGKMFTDKFQGHGEIKFGDSIETLKKLKEKIGIFINDSDHSKEYEYREYQTIENLIDEETIILGDNSHISDSLSKFSKEKGRNFIFFAEKPENHWYPGAGIGISFNRHKK